jgi:ABC-2 type transport system ATP-binding protein
MNRPTLARLSLWALLAVGAALVAPDIAPLDPSVHPIGESLVLGGLVGGAAFLLLARRPLPAAIALPRRRLLARGVVLTVKSAEEEALWRALVLGFLIVPFGRVGALAASSLLFAGAHVGRLGRGAAAHVVTGVAFGTTYLLTGRLHAAIAAHGTYNVLVGASAFAQEDMSRPDTRHGVAPFLGSRRASTRARPMPTRISTLGSPAARLEGVGKSFAGVWALDGFDLELRPGEVLALLGPNGAGKSTAVAIMLGLRRPDVGSVELFGRDPRDPAARRSVGAVLQEVGFPPGLRVRETVDLVRAHYPGAATGRESLERLGLEGLAERHAVGLSSGQRRRLAVALALAGRPTALFLDEPTAGMDALARRGLLRDLATFAHDGGAVLLTTQQLAEAEEIATRIVLLRAGRVILEGTVGEVRARGGLTRVTLCAEGAP